MTSSMTSFLCVEGSASFSSLWGRDVLKKNLCLGVDAEAGSSHRGASALCFQILEIPVTFME